jgi:hypothetical protein
MFFYVDKGEDEGEDERGEVRGWRGRERGGEEEKRRRRQRSFEGLSSLYPSQFTVDEVTGG